MSLIIEVKTKSHNGLPLETLRKAVRRSGKELVESIEYAGLEKYTKRVIYHVCIHESVNLKIEAEGL